MGNEIDFERTLREVVKKITHLTFNFFKENGQSCNFIVWFFYCLVAGHTVHVEKKNKLVTENVN